ncbi:MAG: isoprenylcysteine carboxylmethyltransferase family protein [Sulfuricaulis sp.]|uniref:methyltransferase family protein n=1 Tax=Sulfuricaulis sp. TaxID=2003553 RepID=UPI0025FAA444|nr:isoprenylcysteine carboxylmethyltransferase family protein [Sulfuricaulis sp.]MCR4348227.1 isoprenylcysteine carboxylmethyltransferase family protein [Sulfuricaulis sp.]
MTRSDFVARGGLWVLAQIPLLLLVFIVPVWSGSGEHVPRHPLSVVGAALTAMAVLLTVWGLKSLGDALTPFPKPLSGVRLRRQGVYRWMRHPIYSGVMLASLGWALWWLSLAGVFSALILALFFDRKAAHEETGLCAQYKDYPDYAREVKKFIPGVY